jgi:hypothetical protein
MPRISSLENITIGHSPLSDSLFLYRHGKDPHLALDKREAKVDVLAAIIQYMMHNSPKGAEQIVTLGDKKYCIKVTPVE